MFGGHGIYRDGVMFALEAEGEIYAKADGETEGAFRAAGSAPFAYDTKDGRHVVMSYWRLPDEALEDPDALKHWAELALAAARRGKKR